MFQSDVFRKRNMKEKSPFQHPPSRPRSTMSPIEVFDPEACRHTAYLSFDVSLRIYDSHIVYDSCPRLVGNPGTKWNQHLNISALETGHRCLRFLRLTFKVVPVSSRVSGLPVIGSSCFFNQPFGDAWMQSLAHDTSRQADGEISTSHNFRGETPGLCCCSRGHCCAWCSALRHEAMQKPSLEKKIWKISQEITCQKKWHSIPFGFERNVCVGATQVCEFFSLCKMLHIPNILACALDRYSAAKHLQEDLQVSRWTKVRILTNQSLVLHIAVTHLTKMRMKVAHRCFRDEATVTVSKADS